MKLKRFIFPLILGVLFAGFLGVQHTSAVAGRALGQGYFTNGNASNYGSWSDVWAGGITPLGNNPSKVSFEVFVQNKLNSGSGRDAVGAAYIIETMRGVSGATFTSPAQGIAKAKADYNDWITRINQSSVTMAIESTPYSINSAYIPGLNDIAAYGDKDTQPALVFRVSGIARYIIKQVCANPLGDLPGLPVANTNDPPTGAFVSASCNADGTINIGIHFGDADASAGNPAAAYITTTSGTALTGRFHAAAPYTFGTASVTNKAWLPSYFPLRLYSQDIGGTKDVLVDTQAMPNCAPIGTITLSCTSDGSGEGIAKISFRDPNGGSPLGYIAVPGSGAPLTGQHPTGFVWTVPASRAAASYWSLWLYVQDIGGSGFVLVDGDAYPSCAGANTQTAKCTSSTFPATMAVNTPQSFVVRADLSAAPPSPPTNPVLTVGITKLGGGYSQTFPNQGYTYDAASRSITSSAVQFTPPASGEYTLTWSLSGFVTEACGYGAADGGTPNTGVAGYQPYFRVQGGNISAGCEGTPAADIISWNSDAGTYYGAGAQLAALATGDITSFATGSGLAGGAAAASGSGLALANTTKTGTTYGGGFGVLGCPTDYASGAEAGATASAASTVDLSTLTSGTYTYSANVSLSGTLSPGRLVTLVVTGDNHNAYITNNIDYAAYTLTPNTIPRLNVYVENGNIVVNHTVRYIHGFFSAQGDSPNGNFYTCGDDSNVPYDLTAANAYDACNHQLTIYGAVNATAVVLGRTWGSLTGSPVTDPAETFQYSPELWLAAGSSGNNGGADPADSITSLSPVL